MPTDNTPATMNYADFYASAYRSDHAHPINLMLHIIGTIAGLVLLGLAAAAVINPWWALAFPLVHVLPGLIGHRLFDRDEALGDLRLTRTDFPLIWFLRANHRMTFDVFTGRWSKLPK